MSSLQLRQTILIKVDGKLCQDAYIDKVADGFIVTFDGVIKHFTVDSAHDTWTLDEAKAYAVQHLAMGRNLALSLDLMDLVDQFDLDDDKWEKVYNVLQEHRMLIKKLESNLSKMYHYMDETCDELPLMDDLLK